MRKLIVCCVLFPFLAGCGHPVTLALAAWFSQPKAKKHTHYAVALTVTTESLPYAVNSEAYDETVEATGGTPPYTWSLAGGTLPSGVTLTTSNGQISGTPADAPADYTFTVEVLDSASTPATATKDLTITLYDDLQITYTPPLPDTLPDAVNGLPYGPETITAAGGTGNITWSITSGALPSGVSLATSNGEISGTPSDTVTAYGFTVTVRDDATPPQTYSLALTLNLYDPLQITYTPPLPDAVNGQVYGPETITAAGGTGNITWSISAGTLPSGVSLTTSNGDISGTPADAVALYNFTVQVQDDGSPAQTDTQPLSIDLYNQLQITTSSPLPNAVVDTPYSQPLTATGGDGSNTWSNPTSDLPAWLSLVSSTLSGTPLAGDVGPATFTIRVTDGESPAQTDEVVFSLTVVDEITWEDTFADSSLIAASSNIVVTQGYARLDGTPAASPALDADFDPGDTAPEHAFGNTIYIAQVFTIEGAGNLVGAELLHRRLGGPVNRDLTFEITDVVGGQPGANVYASVTWRPLRNWGWKPNTFSTPIEVFPGQQFALVCSGSPYTDSHYATSDSTNPYAGGDAYLSTDSGSTWNPLPDTRDIGFGIYVDPFSNFNSPGTVESVTITPGSLTEWVRVSWSADTPSDSSVTIQVLYEVTPGSWDLIPDGDLSGNSAGFTSSPVDLSGLNVSTYPAIRLRATLDESSDTQTPRLLDWQAVYKP